MEWLKGHAKLVSAVVSSAATLVIAWLMFDVPLKAVGSLAVIEIIGAASVYQLPNSDEVKSALADAYKKARDLAKSKGTLSTDWKSSLNEAITESLDKMAK